MPRIAWIGVDSVQLLPVQPLPGDRVVRRGAERHTRLPTIRRRWPSLMSSSCCKINMSMMSDSGVYSDKIQLQFKLVAVRNIIDRRVLGIPKVYSCFFFSGAEGFEISMPACTICPIYIALFNLYVHAHG